MTALRHGLSFDIECYYQIVWKDFLARQREPTVEVERNTNYLLDVLSEHATHATFFVLGNVARKYPNLVRRMASEGHELGVHGDEHQYIFDLTPEQFRDQTRGAIDVIEQVASAPVVGHRAAAFSVVRETLWATDVIRDLGLRYDSSIFPIEGKRYGIADTGLGIHQLDNGLYEIPLTVIDYAGRRLPAVGGGYFRMFPYRYTGWAMKQLESEGRPAITYFHPHEFEMRRPRVGVDVWTSTPKRALRLARFNVLQQVGRGRRMRGKLQQLLRAHRFVPLGGLLPETQS